MSYRLHWEMIIGGSEEENRKDEYLSKNKKHFNTLHQISFLVNLNCSHFSVPSKTHSVL